jgi:MFS family permease
VAGYGLGLTGPGIGWFLLPLGVAAFTASAFAARLAQWAGQRTLLVTGFTTIAVGFAFTGSLSVSAVRMDGALILVGFGTGAVMSTLPAMILERLPEQEAGISAGVYNMLRTLGGSVASAAVSAVLAGASSGGAHLVAASGYRTVWIACAVLAAAAAALVLTAVRTAVPSSGSV